jgi:F-type H+-transporting ATPase subunit delta
MRISKQARRDAKHLFRGCQENGILSRERVLRAVSQLIERKPRAFQAILSHFKRLVRLDLDRRTARIETVVPVSPATQSDMQASLNQRYGGGIEFVYAENPALVGGARIQVGSDVYDGSIRARLTGLRENF